MSYNLNTLICEVYRGEIVVEKFKLPKVPKRVETTNKCVRFPNTIIELVEEVTAGTDCTFTAFVIEATRVAAVNLKEEMEKQKDK